MRVFVRLLSLGKKAWVDERREMTEVESGSITSAGRLTSDILERPTSNETQCVCVADAERGCTHTYRGYGVSNNKLVEKKEKLKHLASTKFTCSKFSAASESTQDL